jgi:hypothetical protein
MKACDRAGLEDCIAYWRRNRDKYPRPLTRREQSTIELREKKEREMEKQRLREERTKQGFIIDPNARYPKGSWEEYFQKVEANKRRAKMEEMEEMQALVADLSHQVPILEKEVASNKQEVFGVRGTQMEAMKALIGDLMSCSTMGTLIRLSLICFMLFM